MEPCIFRANITISIVIPYLHTFVLIFTMLCALYGKHTFVAFENVSVEGICSVVLPEFKDTCALHISLFILDIYSRHYFYQSFLNKPMRWQTERFLAEDLLFFVYLFVFLCVFCALFLFFFFLIFLCVAFRTEFSIFPLWLLCWICLLGATSPCSSWERGFCHCRDKSEFNMLGRWWLTAHLSLPLPYQIIFGNLGHYLLKGFKENHWG